MLTDKQWTVNLGPGQSCYTHLGSNAIHKRLFKKKEKRHFKAKSTCIWLHFDNVLKS